MGQCLGKVDSTKVTSQENSEKQAQMANQTIQNRQIKTADAQQMSEQDRVTLDLKKVQDSLNRRVQQMEKNANDAQLKAREFVKNNNKIRAKYALQTKALYEKQIESILNQDMIITKTIRQVQEKFDQLAVSNTLQAANKLMQDVNKAIDMDAMQDTLGNLQELEMNNAKFDELYNQYVDADKDNIAHKLDEIEADIFKSELKHHEQNVQKPQISNNANQQQQHQVVHQQQHQQQDHPQQQQQQQQQMDDIDNQLAMLA
ncbi:hypothetical protein ABPG72_005391 [Tetrahymena utriculariae]